MDRGAWWATLHGVTKSWTGLSDQSQGWSLSLLSQAVRPTRGAQLLRSEGLRLDGGDSRNVGVSALWCGWPRKGRGAIRVCSAVDTHGYL